MAGLLIASRRAPFAFVWGGKRRVQGLVCRCRLKLAQNRIPAASGDSNPSRPAVQI
jgi:hypothetical protein